MSNRILTAEQVSASFDLADKLLADLVKAGDDKKARSRAVNRYKYADARMVSSWAA